MANTLDNIILTRNVCITFLIIVVLISLIIVFCSNVIIPFLEERHYIKMELSDSESRSERRYWKKELRKLYLRQIPIIGLFFK